MNELQPKRNKYKWDSCNIFYYQHSLLFLSVSILAFLAKNLIVELLKTELRKEHSRFLNELNWDRKVKEQAARVAEYLALARRLKESSSEDDYQLANQLAWELAMWLPDEIYKSMTYAIARPDQNVNELTVVISVQRHLLGEKAGSLTANDIVHHAPGIGKTINNSE